MRWLLIAVLISSTRAQTCPSSPNCIFDLPKSIPCQACHFDNVDSLTALYYDLFSKDNIDRVIFDNVAKAWYDSRSYTSPNRNYFDASQINAGTGRRCTLCLYDEDPDLLQARQNLPLLNGGVQNPMWAPFFGPCMDGNPSLGGQCVQHAALFPYTFVGRYYYANQAPHTDFQTIFSEAYPLHLYLMAKSSISDATLAKGCNASHLPTEFQLGSLAMKAEINRIKVYNTSTGAINDKATANFTGAYKSYQVTMSGTQYNVDGWVKWAQHWCSAGCHRNARYYTVKVVPSDYQGKPENSYMSRFLQPTAVNSVVVCKVCPPGYSGYFWNDWVTPEYPMSLRLNTVAQGCYPWFGVIPQLVTSQYSGWGYDFKTSTIMHGNGYDNVQTPSQEQYVFSTDCPVNTYNRECAHAKRGYLFNSQLADMAQDYVLKDALLAKVQCTPCDSGWHTNGSTGAWHCLPPLGQIFTTAEMLKAFVGRRGGDLPIWADRDALQVEPECGYEPTHCQQCGMDSSIPADTLPSDFNEMVIFSNFFTAAPCSRGYYCPDAYNSIQCPDARPYAPPGSYTIANCSCEAGSFLSSTTGLCTPCTQSCAQGYYLPNTCMSTPGQRQDTLCVPCTNVPANASLTQCPSGGRCSAFVTTSNGVGVGVCSFQCNFGYRLIASDNSCRASMRCEPVGVLMSPMPMYRPDLTSVYDQFITSECNAPLKLSFTDAVLTLQSTPMLWISTTTKCLACGQNYSNCYNSRTPWYSINSDVTCVPCPHPNLPNGAVNDAMGDVTLYQRACDSKVRCTGGESYFNQSAWECQSCKDRVQRVCPSSDMQLVGQGCMNDQRPFNATHPQADCVPCQKTIAAMPPGMFLDLFSSGGCAYKNCTKRPSADKYMSVTCQDSHDAVWSDCTLGTPTQPCSQPNTYVTADCSATSNQICSPCTTFKAGYFMTMPCSNARQDTQWDECTPGMFCPGDGASFVCPVGMTSRPGAASLVECFCIAGTVANGDGACEPKTCPDAQLFDNVPGPSRRSVSYIYFDMTTLTPTSTCVPCGSTAFSRGNGVHFASCVCPFGFVGIVNGTASNARLVCLPCSETAPSCPSTQQTAGPSACWKGDIRGVQQPTCVCGVPPFATSRAPDSGNTCGFGCTSPFVTMTPSTVQRTPISMTGSSLYVQKARSIEGWQQFVTTDYADNGDANITCFAVTSDYADPEENLGAMQEHQYAFWAIQNSQFVFYTEVPMWNSLSQALPPIYPHRANNEYYGHNVWAPIQELSDNNANYVIVGLAVSKWQRNVNDVTQRLPNVNVACVVRKAPRGNSTQALTQLYLYMNTMDTSTSEWSTSLISNNVLATEDDIQFVDIAQSNVVATLPSANYGDVYYVAYNKREGCGGMVFIAPLSIKDSGYDKSKGIGGICQTDKTKRIAGFTLRSRVKTEVMVYISYQGLDKIFVLQLSQLSSNTPLINPSTTVSIQASSGTGRLSVLFTTYPLVLSLTNTSGIQAGDLMQRTLLPIESMPWGTAASGLASSATSYFSGVIVASYQSRLYALSVRMCPPTASGVAPQYWDGGDFGQQCVQQQCIRTGLCTGQNEQPSQGIQCRCVDGYVKKSTTCMTCDIDAYCVGGTINTCPLTTGTSSGGAKSVYECLCVDHFGMFWYAENSQCTDCPRTAWCPNQWDSFSCPGTIDASASGGVKVIGNVYPFACVCAQGFVGAKCEPCPEGFYCPSSSQSFVTNMATLIEIKPLKALTQASVEASIKTQLIAFFAPPFPSYLITGISSRLFVQYMPATNRTRPTIAVMMQVDTSDLSNSARLWPATLAGVFALNTPDAVAAGFSIVGTPVIVTNEVRNNTATRCLTGKVPSSPVRYECVCAAGYRSDTGTSCKPCAANTFKSDAGPGQCTQCDAGFVSDAAASQCRPSSDNGGGTPAPSTTTSGSSTNTMIIIAAAAGGGVLALIIGIAACMNFGR